MFLYLNFETIIWHFGKKLPKKFFCHSVKQISAIILPILIDVSFVMKKISNYEDPKKFT